MPVQDVTELSDDESAAAGARPSPSTASADTIPLPGPEAKTTSPGDEPSDKPAKPGKSSSDAKKAAKKKAQPKDASAATAKPNAKSSAKPKTKAKSSAAPKTVAKKPAMKRPAAASGTIRCGKCYYKKDNKFGLKVTPPGSELMRVPWFSLSVNRLVMVIPFMFLLNSCSTVAHPLTRCTADRESCMRSLMKSLHFDSI